MLVFNQMDRGRRKRLADVCEKLGVTLFAGAMLQGAFTQSVGLRVYLSAIVLLAAGTGLLSFALMWSKEA